MRIKDSSGGMLLFTIISTMVISLIAATLVIVSLNHYRIADNECKRQEAIQLAKAGFVYAYDLMASGTSAVDIPQTLPGHPEVMITVSPDFTGVSAYRIRVTVANYELR
jgi:hypothetical protein